MTTHNSLQPDRPADPQALVSREQTQAKMDLRAQAAALIKPYAHYTLADRLEAQSAELGERTLLIYEGRRFSYAEVNRQADRVAHAAAALGLKCGDVCAIALENRPAFFFTWFGLTKLGVTVAFINSQIQGVPLVHAIKTTDAKAVIVGEECSELFARTLSSHPELAQTPLYLLPDAELPTERSNTLGQLSAGIFSDGFIQAFENAATTPFPTALRESLKAEDPTLLIFTSGTTGLPKAAIYSHMRWLTSGDVMQVTVNAGPDDVFYCCLPLYHGAAATSVTSTALAGGSAIVLRRKFSVRRFWPDVSEYGVTVVQYIGEICRYLLNYDDAVNDAKGNHHHQVRAMLGAGLTAASWQRWLEKFSPESGTMDIFEGWGSTEANTNLINLDNYIGSCGRVPDWNKTNFRLVRFDTETQQHVRDNAGNYLACQPGEVGEGLGMIIQHPEFGGGRFEGYTSAAATEQKILRDVFVNGDAYWRSGDLLRFDADGYFYFVDRIGDTFRWKSENVSTQEVAAELADFSGIETINIYGVQVPEHEGRAGMAAIVMQPGQAFDAQGFYDFSAACLPGYACPQFVRVSDNADMTSTFKLRKVDLQKQGYDPVACNEPLFVRDDKTGTYQPLSDAALAAVGFLPFDSHTE